MKSTKFIKQTAEVGSRSLRPSSTAPYLSYWFNGTRAHTSNLILSLFFTLFSSYFALKYITKHQLSISNGEKQIIIGYNHISLILRNQINFITYRLANVASQKSLGKTGSFSVYVNNYPVYKSYTTKKCYLILHFGKKN